MTGTCHAQDQATTVLHEETHAPAVYSPGTEDNGYGYSAATALTSARAVLNADSYALYANGMLQIHSQCQDQKSVRTNEYCSNLCRLLDSTIFHTDMVESSG